MINAVGSVANNHALTVPTVSTKITRGMDISMKEFKVIVNDYILNKNNDLEEVLSRCVKERTYAADEQAISSVLKKLRQ